MGNGLEHTEGTCHHLIGQPAPSFMYLLHCFEKLDPYIEPYFGGKYILNAFGGNILTKGISYASDIHRDIRTFSDQMPLMLNTIVMLNDFTADNGATWLMSGGHEWPNKPPEQAFANDAFQIIAPAGSVVMFNSNLWHRAGENKTNKPRRSVTPMFSKPFYKPQFNYTLQFAQESHSEYIKQVLGILLACAVYALMSGISRGKNVFTGVIRDEFVSEINATLLYCNALLQLYVKRCA